MILSERFPDMASPEDFARPAPALSSDSDSGVVKVLDELTNETSRLLSNVERMVERLAPIRVSRPMPTDPGPAMMESPDLSELARAIDSQIARISQAANMINEATYSLDI